MTQLERPGEEHAKQDYWMRAISFAGLHRVLKLVADFPKGLRAGELNRLVMDRGIPLTRRNSPPAATTLYHHRNTLFRLGALKKPGGLLRVNLDDPDVCKLLDQPPPGTADPSLRPGAMDPFAALVLRNRQCRSLFFNLFLPSETRPASVAAFRKRGTPVKWTRPSTGDVLFQNHTTGRTARCTSPVSVSAVLYGLRYWARDELKLINEYGERADSGTVMFPVSLDVSPNTRTDPSVERTIRLILSRCDSNEWTLFAVSELISVCCEDRRVPIDVLFRAITWFLREWPNHTIPIPTSHALATLTASSSQRDKLALRRFYKVPNGPYVSHLRIHKDVTATSLEVA